MTRAMCGVAWASALVVGLAASTAQAARFVEVIVDPGSRADAVAQYKGPEFDELWQISQTSDTDRDLDYFPVLNGSETVATQARAEDGGGVPEPAIGTAFRSIDLSPQGFLGEGGASAAGDFVNVSGGVDGGQT